MSKGKEISITVIYPVTFTLKIEKSKLNDDEYIEAKREEALNMADQFMQSSPPKPLIHECECEELID